VIERVTRSGKKSRFPPSIGAVGAMARDLVVFRLVKRPVPLLRRVMNALRRAIKATVFRKLDADARPDARGNSTRWNALVAHEENSRLRRKVYRLYRVAMISRHRGIVCRNPLIISLLSPPAIFPGYSIIKSQRLHSLQFTPFFTQRRDMQGGTCFPRSNISPRFVSFEKGRRSANWKPIRSVGT